MGFENVFGKTQTALAAIAVFLVAAESNAQATTGGTVLKQQWFDSALVGDIDSMSEAAAAGIDIDEKDASGATALITASLNGDADVVRFLLERGASTDSRASTGATSLMVAAWQGHFEIVQLLLQAGSDENATTTSNGATALIFAAQGGHLDVVNELLAFGADADAQSDNGTTALMAASREGHLETVRKLLGAGANISLQKRNGASAMTIAATKGHSDVSGLLAYFAANNELPPVQKTAPPDPTILGASLIASARVGDAIGVRSLIERDAPIDHRNDANETALIVAADGAHSEALRILLQADPDLEIERQRDGATALAVAVGNGHLEVVRTLLDAGSKVDAPLGNTRYTEQSAPSSDVLTSTASSIARIGRAAEETPLILAVLGGHTAIAALLLERGADPDRRDAFGSTALIAAAKNGDMANSEMLLEAGAQTDARNKLGETAILLAAGREDWELASLLASSGASLSLLSDNQIMALKTSQGEDMSTVSASEAGGESTEQTADSSGLADVALLTAPEQNPVSEPSKPEASQESNKSSPEPVAADRPEKSPIADPANTFDPDDRETIRKVQSMLNEAGFNAGPADGLMGKRTRGAIRSYEDEIGMEATGEISERIFRRLQAETNG